MKTLTLSNNQIVLVDDDDFLRTCACTWYTHFKAHHFYFYARINSKTVSLHRFIMRCSPKDGKIIDHINHNTLDNRKANLRISTHAQNSRNRLKYKNTASRFKGVQFRKNRNKWIGVIRFNNKLIRCGSFKNEEDAAHAYDLKALELFGEYAHTNRMMGLL